MNSVKKIVLEEAGFTDEEYIKAENKKRATLDGPQRTKAIFSLRKSLKSEFNRNFRDTDMRKAFQDKITEEVNKEIRTEFAQHDEMPMEIFMKRCELIKKKLRKHMAKMVRNVHEENQDLKDKVSALIEDRMQIKEELKQAREQLEERDDDAIRNDIRDFFAPQPLVTSDYKIAVGAASAFLDKCATEAVLIEGNCNMCTIHTREGLFMHFLCNSKDNANKCANKIEENTMALKLKYKNLMDEQYPDVICRSCMLQNIIHIMFSTALRPNLEDIRCFLCRKAEQSRLDLLETFIVEFQERQEREGKVQEARERADIEAVDGQGQQPAQQLIQGGQSQQQIYDQIQAERQQ